jgi:hypothetical protein
MQNRVSDRVTQSSKYPRSKLTLHSGFKKGSGDIRELERVVNRKTQVTRVKLPENDKSGFGFWVGGTQGTRRDPERFWVPKKPLF